VIFFLKTDITGISIVTGSFPHHITIPLRSIRGRKFFDPLPKVT
jgi:hypothetical protein